MTKNSNETAPMLLGSIGSYEGFSHVIVRVSSKRYADYFLNGHKGHGNRLRPLFRKVCAGYGLDPDEHGLYVFWYKLETSRSWGPFRVMKFAKFQGGEKIRLSGNLIIAR